MKASAQIRLPDGLPPIQCKIVDISQGGARLHLQQPDIVPTLFDLVLSASGAVSRRCQVAWRSADQLGVRFVTR